MATKKKAKVEQVKKVNSFNKLFKKSTKIETPTRIVELLNKYNASKVK